MGCIGILLFDKEIILILDFHKTSGAVLTDNEMIIIKSRLSLVALDYTFQIVSFQL